MTQSNESSESVNSPLAGYKRITLNEKRRLSIQFFARDRLRTPESDAAVDAARRDLLVFVREEFATLFPVDHLAILERYGQTQTVGGIFLPQLWVGNRHNGYVPDDSQQRKGYHVSTSFCFCPSPPGFNEEGHCRLEPYQGEGLRDYHLRIPSFWATSAITRASAGTGMSIDVARVKVGSEIWNDKHWLETGFCQRLEPVARALGAALHQQHEDRQRFLTPFHDLVSSSTTLQQVAAAWPPAAELAKKFGAELKASAVTAPKALPMDGISFGPA
jgi:hypothetical protein